MKKKYKKKTRRKYPSASMIRKANLEQLENWRDTLTYPGHGVNARTDPKQFAKTQAAERRLRQMILQRIKELKMADSKSTHIGMIVDKSGAYISSSTDVLAPSEYYSVKKRKKYK